MENKKNIKLATSAVILDEDGKILIVKRSKTDRFLPGYWECPGGKIEDGEDVARGAEREVFEECNLDVVAKRLLFTENIYVNERSVTYTYMFYLCVLKPKKREVILSEEHSDFKWVKLEEIDSYLLSEYMKNAIKKAGTYIKN